MNITTIASSSEGCAYIVNLTPYKHKILIEVGVSVPKIFKAINRDMKNVIACFVSHEHGDHSKYLPGLAKNYAVPIYCTRNTAEKYHIPFAVPIDNLDEVDFYDPIRFKVRIIKLFHDVPNFGFLIYWQNKKLFYCTDTAKVPYKITGLTHLMIECNFDYQAIGQSDRDQYVVLRTIKTHLDFDSVVEFIRKHQELEEIHLLHLSDKHSKQAKFKKEIANLTGVPVYIAQK